jgi:hypothetical protein
VLVAALIASLGTALFRELWCGGCRSPNVTGKVSKVSFGRPVQEQNCGPMVVDEADLREAVLNPSATVAGVPARHAFVAGQLREEPQSLKVS